ncbi:MAG: glutamine--tRNA ligase/YqeY domain fusion protein [Pseudomonadota bacterium]|nr:glutamine--tRNA ligase/YqeY domain fusion protein [Pseudomonadota bacterium]
MTDEIKNSNRNSIGQNFIHHIISEYLEKSPQGSKIVTRFPPEPNGYLHIGHAKSICLNFGLSQEFGGPCYLRFDDTNPQTENQTYVDAIMDDIRWLGFDWGIHLTYASDYFEKFYDFALLLIKNDNAYVEELNADEIRKYRGTLTEPGKNSPFRSRPINENLDLLDRMRKGEFEEGKYVLRAKIDMSSPNINMRDPVLYRILNAKHHRTGDDWKIYPMYDFAHPISDAIEGITHSLCTLEFEDHRPLYNWIISHFNNDSSPRQIEFSRLNIAYTITSKRKLNYLVEENYVSGWDDPRMPSISAMRRRGYPAAALRDFCKRVGLTKKENIIQMGSLENSVRENLNSNAPRRMAVLKPLKVILTNWPEGKIEMQDAQNHPNRPELGSRKVEFSRELYIDRDDFMEDPPRKFFRLRPGGEVRLRYGYIIKCEKIVKDNLGNIIELLCTYDPETRSGTNNTVRKVKGTIHWVSAISAISAEVRLYDRLFMQARPENDFEGGLSAAINPESLLILKDCKLESSLKDCNADPYQFERVGYFLTDSKDSSIKNLVFNRIVSLRDSWAKIEKAAMYS